MEYLPTHWRLDQHPLFHLAQVRLGHAVPIERPISTSAQLCGRPDRMCSDNVQFDAFIKMTVPDSERARYRLMMDKFKEVLAISNNPASCKLTMMMLNDRLAKGNTGNFSGGFAAIQAPIPKQRAKRGRPSNVDIENCSVLSKRKQTDVNSKRCSTCLKHGIIATDHRKGGRCPNEKDVTPSAQQKAD